MPYQVQPEGGGDESQIVAPNETGWEGGEGGVWTVDCLNLGTTLDIAMRWKSSGTYFAEGWLGGLSQVGHNIQIHTSAYTCSIYKQAPKYVFLLLFKLHFFVQKTL